LRTYYKDFTIIRHLGIPFKIQEYSNKCTGLQYTVGTVRMRRIRPTLGCRAEDDDDDDDDN
jgi:hypothetical protein